MARDARECRAQDPRSCYYHGAVIAMDEAIVRVSTSGGNPNPADLDVIHKARLQIEKAEEELRKQQWLKEAMSTPQNVPTPEVAHTEPTPVEEAPVTANVPAPHLPGNQPVGAAAQQLPPREPLVPATVEYNDHTFPPQVGPYPDSQGNPVVFTRHDKGDGIPNGIMLAASRKLSPEEREHLMNLLRYQHTASTRKDGKAKQVHADDIVKDHTERSMFLRSQFEKDNPEEVKVFHEKFNQLMRYGSVPRKDGTQKFPPFRDNVEVVLYYT